MGKTASLSGFVHTKNCDFTKVNALNPYMLVHVTVSSSNGHWFIRPLHPADM